MKDLSGLQVRGGGEVETRFSFDASGSRSRQEKDRVGTNGVRNYEDTLYLGSYEREIHSSAPNSSSSPTVTKTIHRHTLDGIGVYTKKVVPSSGGDVTTVKLTTVLKDHLGSTSVLYTGTWNASTAAFANPEIENQSFNPWGERRDAATLANFRITDSDAFRTSAQDYDRGYTGHEQLDDSGLIHMNGRIYDPEIGRFLSPDPFVQVPEYSQNFNRYSYVMNNPLNAVDPSGFSWVSDTFHKMGSFLHQNWRAIASIVFALAMTYATAGLGSPIAAGIISGATTGAFDAAINGGNSDAIWRGALVSGIQGGISSGILHPIGEMAAGSGNLGLYGVHIVGHGLLGGAANEAMGGKFQDGFLSAAVSTAAGDMGLNSFIEGDGVGGRAGRTIVAGIIGGTASEIGGGKFSNGFYTAAFQHLMNADLVARRLQHAEDFLSVAEGYYGVSESGSQADKDQIVAFHKTTSLDASDCTIGTSWCSSFVNSIMKLTGNTRTNSALARSWASWGKDAGGPVKGAVVVFRDYDRDGTAKSTGHVGFVAGVTPSGRIVVLGGNQSDQVKYSTYSYERYSKDGYVDRKIIGFRVPNIPNRALIVAPVLPENYAVTRNSESTR